MVSLFNIQPNSDIPIYRQVADQVRRLIASDQLVAGEQLPSVRTLAIDLAVNPMTISKAFNLLEQEGLLERRRGVGMLVKSDGSPGTNLIEPVIDELIRQATDLKLNKKQLIQEIEKRWGKS